jgi:16S rRNA (guanine527-N7)-methyltransferase
MPADYLIERYIALLRQYAGTLNLVSQRALEDIDCKIADARAFATGIQEHVRTSGTVVDIGSGAGLPGIIIAAVLPDYHLHLIERRKKRASFLKLVATQLQLDNCTVWDCEVSKVGGITADCVTALAVARLAQLYKLSCHLHKPEIVLMSRKGEDYAAEVAELELMTGISPAYTDVKILDGHGRLVIVRLTGGLGCR